MTTLQGELLARLSVAAAFAFLAMVYSGFVTDETNPTEVTMPAKPDHHVPVPAQVGLLGFRRTTAVPEVAALIASSWW